MTFNFKKYLPLRLLGLVTFIFPLIFSPQKIYSSEYILTCANEDGFLSVFQVKNKSSFKSVTHISSYDPESGEKYSLNLPLQAISKEK
tara:strand:+ start:269 stop:532 length:264 start_codon:yes stop_codon:yes gene_type:complete